MWDALAFRVLQAPAPGAWRRVSLRGVAWLPHWVAHFFACPQVCLAWPVRDIAAGQVVARCKLPLGMADYSKQEFWEEAYRLV